MKAQHLQLANGGWKELSLMQQLAHIGSEVSRALRWKQKGNEEYSKLAFYRSLELLSYTLEDEKNKTRLKEIARTYEVLVDYFDGENVYQSSDDLLQKQFHSFTFAAHNLLKIQK